MNDYIFEWVNISEVNQEVVDKFKSGNPTFDDFLKAKSRSWQADGETATYCFVTSDQYDSQKERWNITRIYGYMSINTMGLKYRDSKSGSSHLSCVEIRMFAIDDAIRKHGDKTRKYSERIFKTGLQNLYEMSTSKIGFKAIYLNANEEGYNLYKRCGFDDLTEFEPESKNDKIDITDCKPMILMINNENIYKIFTD